MKISKALVEAMFAHAQETYPEECCGLLAGPGDQPTHLYRIHNAHETPKVFYEMAPKEQFYAFKNMRHNGLSLLGIYHSHPESPARPSESDIQLAYDPQPHYLLMSLQQRDRPELRAYRIVDGHVTEEPVSII